MVLLQHCSLQLESEGEGEGGGIGPRRLAPNKQANTGRALMHRDVLFLVRLRDSHRQGRALPPF